MSSDCMAEIEPVHLVMTLHLWHSKREETSVTYDNSVSEHCGINVDNFSERLDICP